MQLSNEVKTHVIITFTGGHHFISEKQNEILKKIGLGGNITINNCVVHVKNIAEILTVNKYYETFPKKKPRQQVRNFTGINETIKAFPKDRHLRALKNMAKGLGDYIVSERNQGTLKPEKLLDKMNKRIEQVELS